MKKIITFIVAALTVTGSSLFAQAGEDKIGFKAGVNLANIHGEDAENNKMLIGFHVGGFATIPFGNLAFQPELLISTRGAKYDDGNEDVDESINLMYVDIPLLLKFYFTDNINLHVGPQVGFNLSAKYKLDPEPDNYDDDASEFYESLDLGADLGLEFDSDMGFVVGARYYYGLISVYEEFEMPVAGGTETIEYDIKNNMIQVYFGIGF